MDLTVIILNFNTKELLNSCLKSILSKNWKHKVEVVVVDNASSDGSVVLVKKNFPKIKIIESDKNLGFTGGNNLGLREAKSKYVLLLNSDTEVLDNSLDNLIDFMDRSDYGISSCKLTDGEGNFQPNAGELPAPLPIFLWLSGLDDILRKIIPLSSSYQERDKKYYTDEREVGWVSGAAMMVKNQVFQKIGYLDENIFMYGEDVEYCLRAKRSGFKIGWTKMAEIIHYGGKSSNHPQYHQWTGEFRGLLYIYQKYYGFLAALTLKILMYIFILLRSVAFLVVGKPQVSKTYAKVIFSI